MTLEAHQARTPHSEFNWRPYMRRNHIEYLKWLEERMGGLLAGCPFANLWAEGIRLLELNDSGATHDPRYRR